MGGCGGDGRGVGGQGQGPLGYGGVCGIALEPLGACRRVTTGWLDFEDLGLGICQQEASDVGDWMSGTKHCWCIPTSHAGWGV